MRLSMGAEGRASEGRYNIGPESIPIRSEVLFFYSLMVLPLGYLSAPTITVEIVMPYWTELFTLTQACASVTKNIQEARRFLESSSRKSRFITIRVRCWLACFRVTWIFWTSKMLETPSAATSARKLTMYDRFAQYTPSVVH